MTRKELSEVSAILTALLATPPAAPQAGRIRAALASVEREQARRARQNERNRGRVAMPPDFQKFEIFSGNLCDK